MSYRILIPSSITRRIACWGLPDAVFTEVHIQLRQVLPANPAALLVRTTMPYEGMTFYFQQIDPANRLQVFSFFFHIAYGQDEQTLIVQNAGFIRRFGI